MKEIKIIPKNPSTAKFETSIEFLKTFEKIKPYPRIEKRIKM